MIAGDLQAGLEATLNTYINTTSATLVAALTPIAVIGTTIYMIMLGFAVMRGEVQLPASYFLKQSMRLILVMALAFGGGSYQTNVVQLLQSIEGIFTDALTPGAASVGQMLDISFVDAFDLGQKLLAQSYETGSSWIPIPNLVVFLFGLEVIAVELLIFACGLFPLLAAKIAFAVLMALGPAFVLMALWPATLRFTEAWLSTVLTAVFTIVVVTLCAAFFPTMLAGYVADMNASVGADLKATLASGNSLAKQMFGLAFATAGIGWAAWKSGEMAASLASGATFGNPIQSVASGLINRIAFSGFSRGRSVPTAPAAATNEVARSSSAQSNAISNITRKST